MRSATTDKPPNSHRPSLCTVSMLLTVLAIGLSLAACGSSGSSTRTGGNAVSSNYTKALAFASCMRSHGVPNFPDPTVSSAGAMQIQSINGVTKVNGVQVNGPAFQSGMRACRSKLPNGGQPQPVSASRRKAVLRWAGCMRSHGLPNFPDPTFPSGAGGPALRLPEGIYASSPAFKAAERACGSAFQALS